ncbi:MAG: phage holin family protein [Kofleriaceae bacterium]|nr:phage holin family protein [Kofleriaceae bacterium]
MNGTTGILIKFGVRLVVFGLVIWLVSKRNKDVVIHKRLAIPLIAFLFAALNAALYFILKPILNLATLGAVSYLMPLVINLILLAVTIRVIEKKKWIELRGLIATLYLAVALTIAHGALWVALDYIPKHL